MSYKRSAQYVAHVRRHISPARRSIEIKIFMCGGLVEGYLVVMNFRNATVAARLRAPAPMRYHPGDPPTMWWRVMARRLIPMAVSSVTAAAMYRMMFGLLMSV